MIVNLIKKVLEGYLPLSLQCEVISVDAEQGVCDVQPLMGGPEMLDVRLNAGNGQDLGITPVPKVGSIVTVTKLNDTAAYVALCSEIEEYIMVCDKIRFNDGTLGGLIKIEELVSKINTLEGDLNSLKQVFSTTWVPVPSDGGAALKTAAATWAGQLITETQKQELENGKVTHG